MAEEAFANGLTLFTNYTVVGFAIGVIYEVTRAFFPKKAASVWDFVFMCVAALVLYAYNLEFELADGRFRWFYAAGALFGALLYLISLHRLVCPLCGAVRKVVIKLCTKIAGIFVHIAVFAGKHLKSLCILVYNYVTSQKRKHRAKAAEAAQIRAARATAARTARITAAHAKAESAQTRLAARRTAKQTAQTAAKAAAQAKLAAKRAAKAAVLNPTQSARLARSRDTVGATVNAGRSRGVGGATANAARSRDTRVSAAQNDTDTTRRIYATTRTSNTAQHKGTPNGTGETKPRRRVTAKTVA